MHEGGADRPGSLRLLGGGLACLQDLALPASGTPPLAGLALSDALRGETLGGKFDLAMESPRQGR